MLKKASKNQIKSWRKLSRKKYRESEGMFLAEGERCVMQILKNRSIQVQQVFISGDFSFDNIKMPGVEVFEVPSGDFQSVTDTVTPQGIAAVCRIPEPLTAAEAVNLHGWILAADRIRDPGNFGTIIRTAAWFGASAIVAGDGTVDPWHPKVVRSTAGSTGTVPLIRQNTEEVLQTLESAGWTVYLLDGAASSADIRKVTPSSKSLIVVGNEASGISDELYQEKRIPTRIPGKGSRAESLNAAVAVSIAMFQFANVMYE